MYPCSTCGKTGQLQWSGQILCTNGHGLIATISKREVEKHFGKKPEEVNGYTIVPDFTLLNIWRKSRGEPMTRSPAGNFIPERPKRRRRS
jgi:hypothetical protein